MSNPIKLTSSMTQKKTLINADQIDRIFGDERGSAVCIVGYEDPIHVKESLEEIEDLMLRDQFAMSAMSGITSKALAYDSVAPYAYKCADAMLKARKEGV